MIHEEKKCPICDSLMELTIKQFSITVNHTTEEIISGIEFDCRKDDHLFSTRIIGSKTQKVKVRVGNQRDKSYYMMVHFDEGYTNVWIDDGKKIKIQSTAIQDFSDIEKIKRKIQTYIVFS
jgi:hypothetical protein